MHRNCWTCLVLLLATSAPAWPATTGADTETLRDAGLGTDGPALVAFFQARGRLTANPDHLQALVRRLADASERERGQVVAELVACGPLALPVLRDAAHNADEPAVSQLAQRCLRWLEGEGSATLTAAAARVLGAHRPEGAAEALLAYLPFADTPEVAREVTDALAAVALRDGKPLSVLVRALADPAAARRAGACVALCQAGQAGRVPEVKKLLADPSPTVRLRAALAQARAGEAEAIPILIALLADLEPKQREPVEVLLQELAGEWAPKLQLESDDEIARRVRREAWAGWWRSTEGPALLAVLRKRTGNADKETRIHALIAKLGSDSFPEREQASTDLLTFGTLALPLLRESRKHPDPEIARRVEACMRRIEREPAHHLPLAAFRLLALRRPKGATAALLDYLPFAEDESRSAAAQEALNTLARSEGQADAALVKALQSSSVIRRAAAAEALARGGGTVIRPAVRKLLTDANPQVRLRVARALVAIREREAVPVLIDLLTVLPPERAEEALSLLIELAGDKAPGPPEGDDKTARLKHRDAWAAWWKDHGKKIDLARLATEKPLLGFTVIANINGTVMELGRDNKPRWTITGLSGPVDAWVLPGNRVLIAENHGNLVTERDLTGKILWQKRVPSTPVNVQRLPNGNTFIAASNQCMEVDRTGKEVFTLPGGNEAGYRARNGDIVCLRNGTQCVIFDRRGKELRSFPSGRGGGQPCGLDVLPNGHILIAQENRGKIVEMDATGRVVLEVNAPNVTTASGLPNGHILAASFNTSRVFELDRKGKVVWEYRGNNPFRARRR